MVALHVQHVLTSNGVVPDIAYLWLTVIAHKMRSHLMDATYLDRSLMVEHFLAWVISQWKFVGVRTYASESFDFVLLTSMVIRLVDGTRVLSWDTTDDVSDDAAVEADDAAVKAGDDGEPMSDIAPAMNSYYVDTFLRCTTYDAWWWVRLFPPNVLDVGSNSVNLVFRVASVSKCEAIVMLAAVR